MGAQIRVYRQKITSTSSMKKIFKAMEMIATSRINKSRQSLEAAYPYANALTRAVSQIASQHNISHPLTSTADDVRRSAVVIFTSDRGLAGSYSSNVLKRAEELLGLLDSEGKEVRVYLVGRKAKAYFDFRHRDYDEFWTGDTDNANPKRAEELTERLLGDISESYEDGGVDEIHLVYTAFKSMVTQEPRVLRLLPLEVVDANNLDDQVAQDYQDLEETQNNFEFEPNPEEFLNEVLPRYIKSRIYSSLCHAASSELASRQRAMKAAGDNADELIKKYTRLMNNARQAEITTELTEIVSGAEAL
ncbi:F0F1 ATP synthase subunit gamma [Kocuria sp. cx-455]|uniref:F0F1 ATP synthase subunit gamma n=1 Tax=unclassified Candidatus Sulfotelmatobacter TaxID=2635724 RepID=UPI0016865989|nr:MULTISPECIES: F0F1 ATP synthase subunit gamma [unclassified Candidatus Sulfotelmatobacter]MBD2761110.1 F0F1 ATP synthase subunit gamma [Kocuria sp. cx-116]MBD2764699.1 F0F1 ATP synthase subunit gamma [Kocuria sp. cx-455]